MEDFTCSICLQPLCDPVRLSTGHVYDRHCIEAWFRSRRPPYRCPLSNTLLANDELLPAPEVRSRALLWAAAMEDNEAAAQFVRAPEAVIVLPSAPPLRTPRRAPPPAPAPARAPRFVGLAEAWLLARAVGCGAQLGVDRGRVMRTAFPLLNHGASLHAQPWRVFSCLLTDTNAVLAVLNTASQYALVRALRKSEGADHAGVLFCSVVAAGMGCFAAGMALPGDTFAGGATASCVFAAAVLLSTTDRRHVSMGCTVLVASSVQGLFRGAEFFSHVMGAALFALLHAVSTCEGACASRGALCAYSAVTWGLVAAFAAGASAPWLRFTAPQF